MVRHSRRERALAIGLAVLAGYVDATGFLALGGYFVSFMSGNTTRLGIDIVETPSQALVPAGLIGLFVAGAALGPVAAKLGGGRRATAVLTLVSALLVLAALAEAGSQDRLAIACLALAMGAENAVFERDGEVSIGVTYMTGTLVKLGQKIAGAFLGGSRTAWLRYALLWLGLLAGAVIGTRMFGLMGLRSLWFAAGAAIALTLLSPLAFRRAGDGRAVT